MLTFDPVIILKEIKNNNTELKQKTRQRENVIKQMSSCVFGIKWVAVVGCTASRALFCFRADEAAARRVSENITTTSPNSPRKPPTFAEN